MITSMIAGAFGFAGIALALVLIAAGATAWLLVARFGHLIGLVLIVAGASLIAHQRGAEGASAKCEAAAKARELEIARHDLEWNKKAGRASDESGQADEKDAAEAERKTNELQRELDRVRSERDAARTKKPEIQFVEVPVDGKCPSQVAPHKQSDFGTITRDDVNRLRRYGVE